MNSREAQHFEQKQNILQHSSLLVNLRLHLQYLCKRYVNTAAYLSDIIPT